MALVRVCLCVLQTLLPLLGAVACLVVTILGAAFFFSASYVNYPGTSHT